MQSQRLLAVASALQVASSMSYCENTSLALQPFREACLSGKRPDTMALLKPHCKGTSAPDKMDKRFYACANLNLLMDVC
jgi:hypothetical protein